MSQEKMSSIFVGTVGEFRGSTENPAKADKNGKMPVIIEPVAGKCPNKRVLAGTVAENLGLVPGNTYGLHVRETEPDEEYGRQFNWTRLTAPLGLSQITDEVGKLGEGQLVDVLEKEIIQA